MKRDAIYLDYNAAMPLRLSALRAMQEVFTLKGNPSSIHQFGCTLSMYIENARHLIANCINASSEEIIFTSGGTEANNLVMQSHYKNRYSILTSAIEHDSILKSVEDITLIPVTAQGIVNLEALENLLSAQVKPTFISIMLANNETGVIQPLQDIVKIAKQYNAVIHTDAAQAIGKISCSFKDLEVDYMTISSIKVGGPAGVGALIAKANLPLIPIIFGGGQERGRRSGTLNAAGIYGFASALLEAVKESWDFCSLLRDKLENCILSLTPEANIFGNKSPRLPNTTCFAFSKNRNEKYVMMFDLEGIAISSGSACSSGKIKSSHVLKAMKAPEDFINSAIRISLGQQTTEEEIKRFIEVWREIAHKAYSFSPSEQEQNILDLKGSRRESYDNIRI